MKYWNINKLNVCTPKINKLTIPKNIKIDDMEINQNIIDFINTNYNFYKNFTMNFTNELVDLLFGNSKCIGMHLFNKLIGVAIYDCDEYIVNSKQICNKLQLICISKSYRKKKLILLIFDHLLQKYDMGFGLSNKNIDSNNSAQINYYFKPLNYDKIIDFNFADFKINRIFDSTNKLIKWKKATEDEYELIYSLYNDCINTYNVHKIMSKENIKKILQNNHIKLYYTNNDFLVLMNYEIKNSEKSLSICQLLLYTTNDIDAYTIVNDSYYLCKKNNYDMFVINNMFQNDMNMIEITKNIYELNYYKFMEKYLYLYGLSTISLKPNQLGLIDIL